MGATPALSQKKVFVGGLSWETDEQSLRDYFAQYGPVSDCVIMRDRLTGHPRGFGFVTYDDQLVAERVAEEFHELDGRQVEAKIAVPRSECVPAVRTNAWRATKKVFVGGLPATCREPELHAHFRRFGEIAECQVMYDHQTGNSRGFGFVTFTSESTVDRVVEIDQQHEIMAKHVEVKRAEPKQALEARRGREAAAASQIHFSPQKPAPHQHAPPNAPAYSAPTQHHIAHPSPMQDLRNPVATGPPPAQSPFHSYGPWSSLFSTGAPSSSWNALLSSTSFPSSNAVSEPAPTAAPTPAVSCNPISAQNAAGGGGSQRPSASLGGMGFFTPAQPYSPELAQSVYSAFYGSSSAPEGFSSELSGALPSARAERRFHPYPTRERVERSYR